MADAELARTGELLASQVLEAVPGWVHASVMRVFDQWISSGAQPAPETADRRALSARAQEQGGRAAAQLSGELRRLLQADVDTQWTTPVSLVRALVSVPTSVLDQAGVPPVERDRYAAARFPDDPYGLTPASLAVLDGSLAEPALAWGAAKAAAHRARHPDGRSAH